MRKTMYTYTTQCDAMWCNAMQCDAMHVNACNTIQCNCQWAVCSLLVWISRAWPFPNFQNRHEWQLLHLCSMIHDNHIFHWQATSNYPRKDFLIGYLQKSFFLFFNKWKVQSHEYLDEELSFTWNAMLWMLISCAETALCMIQWR